MLTTFGVVPLALALLVIFAGQTSGTAHRDTTDLLWALPLLYFVALPSIPPLLIGGLMLEIALRLHFAGWAMALLIGALVAQLYFSLLLGFSPRSIFDWALVAFLGLPYAGVFWLSMRLQVPEAFTQN